jgi:hypothetical protein
MDTSRLDGVKAPRDAALAPLRVDERHLLPPIKDRRPHLAVDAVVVEEEGLLAFYFSFKFLEIRKKALADELAVVDHLRVALACARRRSLRRRRDSGRRRGRIEAGTSNKKSRESSTTSSPRPNGSTLMRLNISVKTKSSLG